MSGRPPGLRLLIVADDLTGALDSSCEAAALGIEAAVFPDPAGLADATDLPPVVAVSTASRDGTRAAAVAAMARVAAVLPRLGPVRVMKKVDSRLKGHPGAETAALARALGAPRVLAAPAIPDMGRVQRDGRLAGAGIAAPLDIAAHLDGLPALIPDIADAADFDAALRAAGPSALAVGARGLAAALARALLARALADAPAGGVLRAPAWPPGPALLVVGSRDPVTTAQVARLCAARAIDRRAAPDGRPADTAPPRGPLALLHMTDGPGAPADPPRAAADLAAGAAALLAAGPVATLIASGGETAQALLAALGVRRIAVTGMPLPGIALGRIAPPGGRPLHLMTKSGGFGDPDTLVRLADGIVPPPGSSAGDPVSQDETRP